jgi:hypothetical protein
MVDESAASRQGAPVAPVWSLAEPWDGPRRLRGEVVGGGRMTSRGPPARTSCDARRRCVRPCRSRGRRSRAGSRVAPGRRPTRAPKRLLDLRAPGDPCANDALNRASARCCNGRNGAVRPGTPLWTPLWISNPHPSVGGIGVCGLCRALTPPEHDEVLGRGQGPAQGAAGAETGTGVDERHWRTRRRDGLKVGETEEVGGTEVRTERRERRDGAGGGRAVGRRRAGRPERGRCESVGERIVFEGVGERDEAVRGRRRRPAEARHPNLVMGYRGMRCGSSAGGVVVTDRDRSVGAWVAVIGAVGAQEDVTARFGVGRTVGYRRLRALVDHALPSPEHLDDATTDEPPPRRAVSGNGRCRHCRSPSWSLDGAAGGVIIG